MSSFYMLEGAAFIAEFEKLGAGFSGLVPRLMGGAGTASLGAAAGGLAGGLHGALTAKTEEGESRFSKGLQGAGRGALGGAALGGVAGIAAGPRALHGLAHSNNAMGSFYRAGQRGVHSLTGAMPEGGMDAMRAGAWDAKDSLTKLRASGKATAPSIAKAEQGVAAAQTAQDAGLTSIPGYVKAVHKDGLLPTIKKDLSATWHGADRLHQAAILGAPAFGVYSSLSSPQADARLGEGKAEHYGRTIGQLAGAGVGSVMPFVGNAVAGETLSTAGQYAGRGVDWAARKLHGG